MGHVAHANESCLTYEWVIPHMPCLTYEWVMFHIWMSHVSHMNESYHTHHVTHINESCHSCECVTSCRWTSHVTHMIEFRAGKGPSTESEPIDIWVMSHIWMGHVTHVNVTRRTYEYFMSHMWMSHLIHMNESCHTSGRAKCQAWSGRKTFRLGRGSVVGYLLIW